jgi:uncharacterized damage-inducible protein DinB
MNTSLQILFDTLEQQRNEMMAFVGSLSHGQLNERPLPGKWSIAEIISHIIAAEKLSLLYLKKKVLSIETVKDSGLWEEIKINLLKISQRMPGLKFKVPKTLEDKMPLIDNLDALAYEWAGVRTELRDFLEKIPNTHTKRLIYRHVRAGYLDTRHALIFFREHIIHHTPQIKRLVRAA